MLDTQKIAKQISAKRVTTVKIELEAQYFCHRECVVRQRQQVEVFKLNDKIL